MDGDLQISIVIPLLNEEESLKELFGWIKSALQGFSYEVIFIDDGSKDGSWSVIQALKKEHPDLVKAIKFRRNYGKSAALNEGFKLASGKVVFTMDADLQDSPDELPKMYEMIVKEGYDLVSGWKKKRHDPITKTIPTKLYNWATRVMSGIKLHDFNCGLKAYKNELVKSIEVYGEMHRYIPVMASRAGFRHIGEKVVQHRARKYGHTKFGLSRFIYGPLDLLSILFISKFGKRPMHVFGVWGMAMFAISFCIVGWMIIDKLFVNTSARLIADRAEFFIALTAMIIGFQLFLAGFLGELVSRSSSRRDEDLIEKII